MFSARRRKRQNGSRIQYGTQPARGSQIGSLGRMTRLATIRALLLALVAAVWALPITRAVRLLSYTLSMDDGSINAGNDTSFDSSLVVSYCFSFAVALVIAWILP